MKAKDIRELSIEEHKKKLRDARADMLNLRMQKESGQIEKTHELPEKRREIARLETILTEKQRAAASS